MLYPPENLIYYFIIDHFEMGHLYPDGLGWPTLSSKLYLPWLIQGFDQSGKVRLVFCPSAPPLTLEPEEVPDDHHLLTCNGDTESLTNLLNLHNRNKVYCCELPYGLLVHLLCLAEL